MKKLFSLTLILSLIFTMTIPSLAAVDATSSATKTPAPTVPATAPAAAPVKSATVTVPSGDTYVVVAGDAMWKIAKKFNMTLNQLKALNPQIKNISMIKVGEKINVKATAVSAISAISAKKLYHGFGLSANYRIRGEQKDNLNFTTASVVFDQDGKIVDLTWDVMEVTYALFPGWVDPNADQVTKDAFVDSIDDVWQTKREEGYDYDMTHLKSKGVADNLSKKEWFEQLDYFELFFKGKTVSEVEAWFKKYTDANGRPYKMAYPDKLTDADKAITVKFTPEEKAMLVDVTSSATMSLEDPHSHFVTALKEAYTAREEIK